MSLPVIPDPEYLGRRRFLDNKSFRSDLSAKASRVLSELLGLMPSNYPPGDPNTNISILLRTSGREFGRMLLDSNAIFADGIYTGTRIEYLQEILGERLFLGNKVIPQNYTDEYYRRYLIALKDAYLKGSGRENIEDLASKFTNLPIRLRELYLEARKPDSSYSVVDTHKMIVEVMVDNMTQSGRSISDVLTDLNFFVNIIRPAHVLYDTNLIWTDQFDINKIHDLEFGDTGGGCVPTYYFDKFSEPVIYAYSVIVLNGPDQATGQIGSTHEGDYLFFLNNGTKVITEPGTEGTGIFNSRGKRILFSDLRIGDWVRIAYVIIPGRFQWLWLPPWIDPSRYDQFYPDVFRRPAVQEFVRKYMDAHGRFPLQTKTTPTTICDRWVQDVLQPLYEDMRSYCKSERDASSEYTLTLQDRMWYPRFSNPHYGTEDYGSIIQGSNYWFSLTNTPLTDGSGNPAVPANIGLIYDGTFLTDSVLSVDASSGNVVLKDSSAYWDSSVGHSPLLSNVLEFSYKYLSDGTDKTASDSLIYGISHWQLPKIPVVSTDGTLAGTSDVTVYVDGTYIPNALSFIKPILGHISISDRSSFWSSSPIGRIPVAGDTLEFSYSYGENRAYTVLMDDYERVLDTCDGISFLLDGGDGSSSVSKTYPVTIGYRYRAYLLHHSSVLNSPDTLLLNNYQKPVNRASLINQQHALNHFNLFYSPEFLYDKSSNIILDDKYLENGLDPVLKLKEGTPPFQKTFAYQPGLVYERKLQDIRKHRHPLLYSDLLLKEFPDEGESVPLSSICDSDSYAFKVRIPDEVPPLEECEPWLFMDTVVKDLYDVYIPGERVGVSNLRVASKHLRDNFILRETEDIGVISTTYSVMSDSEIRQTVFQLPDTVKITDPIMGIVDFPALPVMRDRSNMADPSDVSVFIDGTSVPGAVLSLIPDTGYVELIDVPDVAHYDTNILTQRNISAGELIMSAYPADATSVIMSVTGGIYVDSTRVYGTDYYVLGQTLCWRGGPLESTMTVDSTVKLSYMKDMLTNTSVEFRYHISNFREIEIIDPLSSRILDNGYVLGGPCPDPFPIEAGTSFEECYGFLSDYSDGIKLKYFNKSTYQVEEHVFSGPVFEMYEPAQDEFGSTDSFPNALVRVPNPIHSGNPFKSGWEYDFVGDYMARFKKKTFKELLPDRTFRTIKITEMVPV